ncbi:MAG TPA: pyridoxal-phosphate dependent enzyme, partial [Candidatus Altiarchaeales archaeon]|nr:pyridoxal-phosphate dependent enzyme [Candidatus Altiarchaeales archaeon]HEX55490.1 pyridoxal-phosphate dependent enzyme [Candidatus Altiarchaeales archaeon]
MGKFPYQSGVWRFRELVHPLLNDFEIVSRPEGNTNLYHHKALANFTGIEKILLKHEGENPTGSFKDRGMTVGISEANRLGMRVVGCASTGNTSASLASYAGLSNMKSI